MALRHLTIEPKPAFAEVEFGLPPLPWAALPIDPGTKHLVSHGLSILWDRERVLARLQGAVSASRRFCNEDAVRRSSMIRGKSIRLRTVRETDLDRLYVLLTEIAHRGDFVPLHIPSESTLKRQFHETGFWSEDAGRFLIVNQAEEIVGSIWFFKSISYFDGLEIGYTLFDPQQRRRGIMTEALSLCVDYLFQSTKIHRVQLIIAEGNIASERVAQKCGFTYEGMARQAMFQRGRHQNMKLYSLLRHEVETCLPSRLFSSDATPDR